MIVIDNHSRIPIYEQLYNQLKNQIITGSLTKGMRLPATRALANEYGISRNSVIAAYEQLLVEGYIKSKTGSGYYVEELTFPVSMSDKIPKKIQKISERNCPSELKYNFQYGNLEYNCYLNRSWRKCFINAFDRLSINPSLNYLAPEGLSSLRESLSVFLSRSRGVKCDPEQIIITNGHQSALQIICSIFYAKDWGFAMEEPGYDGCRIVFERNGFTPNPIPVTENGIDIAPLNSLKKSLLYITPSHQFPTGCILPISKRLAILKWATTNDNYIIEDDYDSELRYKTLPIPSLQSLDSEERTIYLGTFSKSLSPDLRISYLVLPKPLLSEYKKIYKVSNSNVPTLLQEALSDYIRSGEYEKHINMVRTHYKKKNSIITTNIFSSKVILSGAEAGLHFIMTIDTDLNQKQIISRFANFDVAVYPTERYWIHKSNCPQNQILIGYSSIPSNELDKALKQFHKALSTF